MQTDPKIEYIQKERHSFAGLSLQFVLILVVILFQNFPVQGRDTAHYKPAHNFFLETGFQFGSNFIGSVGLTYIHPRQAGIRFTYRKYYNIPENEPLNFRECGTGWFSVFDNSPLEEADYYELVFIKRVATKFKRLGVNFEAGPHFSVFKEIHYSKSSPQATCYFVEGSWHNLVGLSAHLGLEFAFSKYAGIQLGLNGLFNSKRVLIGPELKIIIGKIR